MDDKSWRKHLDPEDMTADEIYERVVDLLVAGLLRLILEEEGNKKGPAIDMATEKVEDNFPVLPAPSETKLILESIVRGRIPFGHGGEAFWIKRIQELNGQGFSSEKIAKQLNQEDHESKRAGKWSRTAVWRILKRLKEKGVTE